MLHTKVHTLLLILFYLLPLASIYSQPDTTALKKIITNISSEKEHIEFWDYIHHRDQDMMTRDDKYMIDQENLISVSYYLNRFGYPDQKYLGRKSQILNYVWVHTISYEVRKLTFPIILQAYLTKNISEHDDLREYFLQGCYHRYFDDNAHLTKPLGVIFKELGMNVTEKINIEAVIHAQNEFNQFLDQEVQIMGTWKLPDVIDTNMLNGKVLISKYDGQQVMMYKVAGGIIYFKSIYDKMPDDPVELERMEGKAIKYRAKQRITTDYYQITDTGDLKYFDNDGKRVLDYQKE